MKPVHANLRQNWKAAFPHTLRISQVLSQKRPTEVLYIGSLPRSCRPKRYSCFEVASCPRWMAAVGFRRISLRWGFVDPGTPTVRQGKSCIPFSVVCSWRTVPGDRPATPSSVFSSDGNDLCTLARSYFVVCTTAVFCIVELKCSSDDPSEHTTPNSCRQPTSAAQCLCNAF